MTARPSDPDGWYDPDKPAPVPEGMETTAEERARAKARGAKHGADWVDYLLRDFDRAIAEIARLTAINADLLAVNLSHAEAIVRIAELEADANAVVHLHALAIEVGNLPDGDESVYDFLRRIITTGSPASIRARSDALRARLTELEAEVARLQAKLRSARSTTGIATADRIAELEAALAPFAEWSRKLDAEFGDHEDDIIAGGVSGGLSITFGDLRRAARARPTP